jgi:hypothetical protein
MIRIPSVIFVPIDRCDEIKMIRIPSVIFVPIDRCDDKEPSVDGSTAKYSVNLNTKSAANKDKDIHMDAMLAASCFKPKLERWSSEGSRKSCCKLPSLPERRRSFMGTTGASAGAQRCSCNLLDDDSEDEQEPRMPGSDIPNSDGELRRTTRKPIGTAPFKCDVPSASAPKPLDRWAR